MFWRLDENHAFLQCGELTAEIDLARPSEGLSGITFGDSTIGACQLFRLKPMELSPGTTESPADVHIRGADLVATYAQLPGYPISREVYSRALEPTKRGLTGVEVWISPQTDLLKCDPVLACAAVFPVCGLHQLTDADLGEFTQHNVIRGKNVTLTAESGYAAFLFRPADADWTFCEMIHPADYARATIDATDENQVCLTAVLFAEESLERGVIRRARIRGLFMPRQGDSKLAVEAYQHFANSNLPLTA